VVEGADRSLQIVTGTGQSMNLWHDGARGNLLRASGGMAMDVAGFFVTSGTLSVEKSSQSLKLADGSTVTADMLSIGGTGLNAFAGINGPYRGDTNGDGRINLDDEPNPNALGLSLSGAEFGLALLLEQGGARQWLALEAKADEVVMVGVPGITASAQNLSVGINLVRGATGNADSQVVDFKAKPLSVYTGYGKTLSLGMDGSQGELIRASGDFELAVADFVSARGALGFEKSVQTIKVNGQDLRVDGLLVGGTGLNVFAGVGGPYFRDSNGDGAITAADTPNPQATGFALSNAEFAMAILSTSPEAQNLPGVTWFGLEVSADSVGFVGMDALTLEASQILVEINQVSGLSSALDPVAYLADFEAKPLTVSTGTGTSRVLDVTGKKGPLVRASADVQIGLGDFFYAGGSLGFEKSTRMLTLGNGVTVSHDVLTLGGTNLQAFAGLNGGPVDSLGADALGFSLSGVEFGMVVAAEREGVVRALDQAQDWRDIAVSPVRQAAVAAGAQGGLWTSDDQGMSWQKNTSLAAGLDLASVAISADGLKLVVAVTDGRLLLSADGGQSWTAHGARADRYTDVVLGADGALYAADTRSTRTLDFLELTGTFSLGQVLSIEGVAPATVRYTVVAADLSADGKGGSKRATDAQMRAHVAQKLATLINETAGALGTATARGASLQLTAKSAGAGAGRAAGWFDLQFSSSDGKAAASVLRQAAAAGAKTGDETSTVADNLISDNDDEFIAEMENIVTAQLADSANLTFSGRMKQRFDATFGMGEDVKTLTTGIESVNHNSVGYFNDGLIRLFNKHGKDIVAVNKGFKVLQDWGKEQLKNVDLGLPEIPLSQWLQSAKLGDANRAIVEDFGMMVEELFGVDGVSSGVMSDAILRPYFGDELNVMFSTRGFWESERVGGKVTKMKTAFKLPPGLNEKGVKYSWANADLNDKYNSISFLSEYADSMHAVQTRIAIGESFSLHHGKTLKQIKEEGLDEANYVRIDQQDEFGKYIDPNKLFDAADVEKMQFLKDYVTYKKSFSGATQKIVDMSDRITAFLKPSHTTWRLGHHVTTVIGEEIMNKLAGVNKISYYHNGVRILKKFDPSMYKGDENLFRTYAEMSAPKGMAIKATDFDGVKYINSETGKVTFLPDEAIAAAIEKYGVAVRMGSGTVEDLELSGLGELRGGIVSGVSKINKKLGKFSSHRDNFFRVAHFIKEIEQGGPYASFEEAAIAAARKVHEWHPTTYGLSAFERKNMRRAVFFYTWQRIAATKVFELMLNAPGAVTVPSKIQYAFAEANGFAPESFGRPWDPNGLYASWDTSNLYGPQFQGPAGKGDAWGFGPAIPQLDILNGLFGGFTIQPGESGLDALTKGSQTLVGNNFSPLPKWFAELSTGNRVGTGGDIRNPLEYAIDQVGGINTLSRLTGIGRDVNKNITPTEEAEQKIRTGINWITGQKLKDYATGQSLGQWKRDQAEQMKRLTGQD
jgi:hypothetical protein